MIEFKQRVQLMNRLSIPAPVAHTLGIKPGDEVSIFCDEEQKMLYVKFLKVPVVLDRESGILTKQERRVVTETIFKPITSSNYKPITGKTSKETSREE